MTTNDCSLDSNHFFDAHGKPSDRAIVKVRTYLTDYLQEFISRSPFAVMATSNAKGECDASPKGGTPGFVKVLDERRLLIPDVAGNRLFQSYLNIDVNPHVGLIFFIPGVNETARVNGKATIVNKEALDRQNVKLSLFNPDENAKNIQGLVIEVEEAFGHCPRALKFSELWNVQEISANIAKRPISPYPPGGVKAK